MNILVLSHLYPRPNDPSYGIFVHRQVKQLQKFGHNVIVLSPIPWVPKILQFRSKWCGYNQSPNQTTWDGVKVYYPRFVRLPGAWFRALSGFSVYASLASLALKLHHQYNFDVIHSHFLLPDGLAGIHLSRKLKLPFVCTIHGADAVTHPKENKLNFYFSKVVVTKADRIVAVSQALRRVIESFAISTHSIQIVYNGADIEEPQKFQTSHTEPIVLEPYLLFVGRDIQRKGLKILLDAFSQLVDKLDHQLVVIGPEVNQVNSLAPDLTKILGNRLITLGPLPPDTVYTYMKNCDVFILPSYSEGLPCVVLEAMAYAKPVIATKVMGIPEEVIDGETGLLIKPGDVSGLVHSIQILVNNPTRAQKMGKLGQQRVSEQFTWERNTQQIIEIYQNVRDTWSMV